MSHVKNRLQLLLKESRFNRSVLINIEREVV